MPLAVRSRLARAARWLVPSIACGAVGALAAGAIEGGELEGAGAAITAAGFLGLIALPALIAASAVARGLWQLWQPERLAAALTDEHGAAPRLAGWLAFLLAAALALAWAMFYGTWLLASWTAFKPVTLGIAEPVLAIGATLVLAAVSRPAVRLFAAIAQRLDAFWRRTGSRTLLRPRVIFAGTAIAVALAVYLLWILVAKRKLGPLDTSPLVAPAAGLGATAAAHLAWRLAAAARRARAIAAAAAITAALATLGTALAAVRAEPGLTLEIWGDRPLAGFAIERIFDLDAIRADLPLTEFRPPARPGAPHPDVILITIDTVRADRTPPYGGPAEMPALRALAERGAVFERAFAPSNVTRRSIPSLVLGYHPNRVRGRVVGWALRVDPRHVLLAERMRAAGYDTAGFMCCKSFWGSESPTGLQRGLAHLEIEADGPNLAQAARDWLDARERRGPTAPLFLWMHFIDPHNWTQGGEPRDDADKRKQYDRALTRADLFVATVLGAFTARPPDRAPLVAITADHGEGLGDHGSPYHSVDLYNSSIHVPLVLAGPGIANRRIPEVVSLTDLTPTLLELAGFEPPSLDGRSVADLATGRRPGSADAGIAFAAMIKDRSNPGGVSALIRGGWKLIESGGVVELYDLHTDFGERTNLAPKRGDIVIQLRRLLREHQAYGARSPFD